MGVPRDQVLLLLKAIYGLKQAPLLWFTTAREFLLSLAFVQSTSDPCLFILNRGADKLILSLYVDDLILTSSSQALVDWVMTKICARFPIRDIKELSWTVGVHLDLESDGLKMSQEAYIKSLVDKYLPNKNVRRRIPMATSQNLEDESKIFGDMALYQAIVGCLNYLAHATRPDIMFAVNCLSRSLLRPTVPQYLAAIRVIEYLNSSSKLQIPYKTNSTLHCLHGFCDASFPGLHTTTGLSTTGYCVFYNNNLIQWKSRRQSIVCLSTMEAELEAIVALIVVLIQVQNTLGELGYSITNYTIYTDSEPAINYLNTPSEQQKSRTRHLAIRFHFIRSLLKNGTLILKHVRSVEQIADIFTKPLPRETFELLRRSLLSPWVTWEFSDFLFRMTLLIS